MRQGVYQDHPRIRGVHFFRDFCPIPAQWIIPAYAGYTCDVVPVPSLHEDHPRIRGVHAAMLSASTLARGSSPHTRGTQSGLRWGCPGWRIIPAYAGYTNLGKFVPLSKKDHPRIRGVHHQGLPAVFRFQGSSPHTRGTLSWLPFPPVEERIIPAYAGYTHPVRPATLRSKDHPRIRGVHEHTLRSVTQQAGSSPHTRGTPLSPRFVTTDVRIIPAYAGYTGRSCKWFFS